MLNILLAAYLLIVAPALNLRRSLRPKSDKPARPLLRRYWSMSWQVLILLAVLIAGSWQSGYTLQELGFDIPLSTAGARGLGFAVLLLGGLAVAGSILERRKSPQAQEKHDSELLNSPLPWPSTPVEILSFTASMALMTVAWEILYRGFLLLVLAPGTGLPVAVAVSALAYGIAHGYKNPKQLIASIVSAFVFTIAYAATHSLWWLMLIHAGLPLGTIPAVLRAQRRRQTKTAHAELKRV
jgi:membrane protease YdiL (CAAX protease family)